MYKIIQKNQKKLLAVFAALLMVVFILPNRNSGGMDRENIEMGKVNGKVVKLHEYEIVEKQWRLLNSIPIPLEDPRRGNVPSLTAFLFRGSGVYRDLVEHPDMFFLLIREAEARGIAVSPDALQNALMTGLSEYAQARGMGISPEGMRQFASQILARPSGSVVDTQLLQAAGENLMRVQALIDSVGSAVKVSEPELRRRLAEEQQVKLNVVEFDVDAFKAAVPAPSE